MIPFEPKPEWIERFVRHVGERELNVDPARVWRDAEAIFDTAGDMPPEDAAEIWMDVPEPDPLVKPDGEDDEPPAVSDA